MKILIISNLYPPHFLGGYEILCEQVVNLLKKSGHEILVLTSNHQNPEVSFNEVKHNVVRKLKLYCPFSKKAQIQRLDRLKTGLFNYSITKKVAKSFKPDIVFVWSQLRLTLASAKACQNLGYKCFFTFNDDHIAGYQNSPFAMSLKNVLKFLADQTLFRFNCLSGLDFSNSTSISKCLRDQICKKGVDISNSKIIYQGIPIEKYPARTIPPQIPSRTPSILYAGQLHHYKGVHTLLRAVNLLDMTKRDKITLNIVGDGPEDYKRELKNICNHPQIEVNFLGRKPSEHMPEIYRSHDVFVFPSIWPEPFGLTHLEAMASKTPVISTNDGGHGEFLEHEVNALVFLKDDEKSLAAQLERMLSDRKLCEKITLQARKMVETRFSLNRYVDELENVLKTIIVKQKK